MKFTRLLLILLVQSSILFLGIHIARAQSTLSVEFKNLPEEVSAERIRVVFDWKSLVKLPVEGNTLRIPTHPGVHLLELNYVGFREKIIQLEIAGDTLIQVHMESEARELDEVQISGNRITNVKSIEMGVQRVSVKELSKIPLLMGEIDIQRGLQTLPGVTSVGEGANGLNIRGGSVDQNLLLFEGCPVYNPTHLFGLFSVIPSEAIGSIDLYKGSIPVRYGGRIASVIDLKAVEPSLNSSKFNAGIGLISSKAGFSMPIISDKMAISVAARSSFTGRFLKVFPNLKDFDAGFNELFSKLLYSPNSKNKIHFNYYGTRDHTLFVGVKLNSAGNTAEDSEVDYGISNLSAIWNHQVGLRFFGNLTLSNSRFRPGVTSPDSLLKIRVSNEVINRKVRYETLFDLGNERQVETGVEMQLNELQPGNYNQNGLPVSRLPTERSLESSVYFSFQTSLGSLFKMDAGLRYSVFNNLGPSVYRRYEPGKIRSDDTYLEEVTTGNGISHTYSGLEPRISLVYLLSNQASFKANFTVARQYIQIVTNTTTPLPISRWKTSDLHLRPQISQMWSLGYYLSKSGGGLQLSAEAYLRETQNFTEVKLGSDFLLKDFVETELLQGLNKSYGLELNLVKNWPGTVLNTNYTYSRSYNRFQGQVYESRINEGNWYVSNVDRPHSINANVKIQQSAIHHFSFAFTYASGRPYTAPEGLVRLEGRVFPIYTLRNNQRIPAYHRLDFSWMINNPSRKKGKFKSNWAFNVYNLYSRKNIYSVFFNNKVGSVQAYRLSVFASAIPSLSYNMVIE